MKRILNLLIALVAVTTAMAATVNRQQARQQAAQFLQQRGAQLGSDPTTVNGRRVQAADQSLYVFNAEGGRGFVVVAGDDRADAILGYTLEGSYDEADMPPAFMEWLAQMEAEIKALGDDVAEARTNAPKASSPQVAIHAAIAPLIQTTWNQGNTYQNQNNNTDGIYNIRLPKVGGNYPCTGCVAVCGAQIMYYYRWPQGPTAEVPGYSAGSSANTSAALPATTFQWDKMKTSYSSSDAYSDAAYAVADLLLYAGYAAKMKYGVDGSSASQVTLVGGMVDYFGYDPNWKSVSRANYSVAAWDEIIYNELASGRPVIYDGASAANGSGGHAFICDGYDGEGLYHFNWGWGGSRNGYFKLSATNPDGANDFPGYVFGNSAVIGIQPATGTGTEPVGKDLVATAFSPTLENTTAKMMLRNENGAEYGFGLGMAELNEDGTLNIIDEKYSNWTSSTLPSGTWWNYTFEFNFSEYDLTEGVHKLVPISLLNGETEWKQCKPAILYYKVIVNKGEITVTQHPTINLEATDFVAHGLLFANKTIPVDVTITSKEDDYTEPLYFFASTSSSKGSPAYIAGTGIPGGGSEDVRFYFTPTSGGTWNFWVATDQSGSNVIGTGSADIEEAPTGTVTLELVSGNIVNKPGGIADYEMTVKNTGEVAFYRNFMSHLWIPKEGNNWGWSSINDAYTDDTVIEPGEEVTVTLTFTSLTEGGTYCIDPRYPESYTSDNLVPFNEHWWNIEFTYTAPAVEPDPIPGDFDGDGELTVTDVEQMASRLIGGMPIADDAAADVNGDGEVNIADLTALIKALLKKGEQ